MQIHRIPESVAKTQAYRFDAMMVRGKSWVPVHLERHGVTIHCNRFATNIVQVFYHNRFGDYEYHYVTLDYV